MSGIVANLSERESQILSFASKGYTDKEIAQSIGIGAGTVKTYWSRIRGKLGAGNRTEAVASEIARMSNIDSVRADDSHVRTVDWAEALAQSAPFCFVVINSEQIVEVASCCGLVGESAFKSGVGFFDQSPRWIIPNLRKAVLASQSLGECILFECANGPYQRTGGYVSPIVRSGIRVGEVIVFDLDKSRKTAGLLPEPEPTPGSLVQS